MFSKRAPTVPAEVEANRVAIQASRELFESKISTLRFELVTAVASLKEMHGHERSEVARRLEGIEEQIKRLDATNRDYVLREVYEKDEERLYSERRESLATREHGRRAMTMALISALVSAFNIAVSVLLHYLN
ncbi:hypothetical protein [Paraburkholderia hospita]|uniref:hypothetical protein n=1 Tax=Paraburkholderia hospita TaxID=169430 RepID=UPI000DEF3B79|nr:hypothetical protein [Paraburkholderia hospita]AXF04805.1 hypothetical protein CUJ88_41295 [Paraburkholderia hospita]